MRAVGLVEACDDPRLLAFPLWPRQRELLADVEAGPRVHVWALGRRSSKSTMAALVGLWSCLLRPELLASLRPGERGYAVAVATNLRQARLIVRAALSIVERSPLLGPLVEAATDDEIRFVNGTAFAAFPCTSRGGRGWPIFALLLDEFAHFLDDTDGPAVADRVFEALLPSLAQFGEAARVIVSSTPWGSDNLFADLFRRASAGELTDAIAQQAATSEVNPTFDVERERELLDEEGFAQEYLASFAAGGAAFLDEERVAAAVVADRRELGPGEATGWVAGLDPAFSRDPFGLALVGRRVSDGRLVLGLTRRWKPKRARGDAGSFEQRRLTEDRVLAEVADLCRRYGAQAVTDQHAAPAIVARLRRAGVFVRTQAMTAATKTDAFSELRQRLYAGELELYGEPQLLAELRRLRTRYASGRAAVVNPHSGDSHGDQAQALALAVWAHRRWSVSEQSESRGSERYDSAEPLSPLARRRHRGGDADGLHAEWERVTRGLDEDMAL